LEDDAPREVGCVTPASAGDIQQVVDSAVAEDGIESAAIFVVKPGSADLELAAAAGVAGPALEGLVAAVRDPGHPIRKTLDEGPTYDVRPKNPGGPALRTHLPLVASRDGRRVVVGVLALAHEGKLSPELREKLARAADTAAELVARPRPRS
jgi:hypothetical protein